MAGQKLSCDFNYLDENSRIIRVPAGTVIEGKLLKMVQEIQPTWLVPLDAEIVVVEDEGRLKDLRLTEAEKPSKPKDEDPKDPDKKKKL